eukprot:5341023-Pleurochrysis_carterae.AAC.1
MVRGGIAEQAAVAEVAAGMIGIGLVAWRSISKIKKKADRVATGDDCAEALHDGDAQRRLR